ncbi:WIAG-tail domain, partial [Peribacillus sp. NPDC056705]|uniref:WIAG-tail domain n=1 Tax=Peribacillus sp. NPDC056705 TaxID=3345918 RepID=UPI003747D257
CEHLSYAAVTSDHISQGAVTGQHLSQGAITSQHLREGAVTGQQLAEATVTPQHMSFTPVRGTAGATKLQQFGMAPFVFDTEDLIEVTVQFEESFVGINYVIVGMSNNPAFLISLKSQREDAAVLEVSRQPNCDSAYGFLSWIAIGPSA